MTTLIIAVVIIGLLLGARTLGGIIKTGCMGLLIGITIIVALLYYFLRDSGGG
jgi:membrane-bound metal-dependent hydrolase YbcI (DUF457 family)